MANEKTAKKVTVNVGDFYPADLSRVKPIETLPEFADLKSERDDYVAKYEAIRFDKAKDVQLDRVIYDKIHGMYEDIKERGVQDPAQGFIRKGEGGDWNIYINVGRQRRGLLDLMKRREQVRVDDKFVVNIVKEKDVLEMLQSQWASNEHRVEESFFSQAAYIRGFRKANWPNAKIAEKMHVSEMLISMIVRVDESPYLSNLVKTRRVQLETAASAFATKEFLDAFRDPTSHKINEAKLEEKVESILTEMTEKGLTHSRNAVRAFMKRATTPPEETGTKTHISRDQWKRIKDAPPTIVPLPFQLLAKAVLGEAHHTIADLIKIHKDLEWLAKVEWRSAAEIKKDQKAAAAANAASEAKANAAAGVISPNEEKRLAAAAAASDPHSEENEDDDNWSIDDEDGKGV